MREREREREGWRMRASYYTYTSPRPPDLPSRHRVLVSGRAQHSPLERRLKRNTQKRHRQPNKIKGPRAVKRGEGGDSSTKYPSGPHAFARANHTQRTRPGTCNRAGRDHYTIDPVAAAEGHNGAMAAQLAGQRWSLIRRGRVRGANHSMLSDPGAGAIRVRLIANHARDRCIAICFMQASS